MKCMKRHIGTKLVNAKPMTRLEYSGLRGWSLPEDQNGSDEGFMIGYTHDDKPNTESFADHVSWLPKKQFKYDYRELGSMLFGHAVEMLKRGFKVARIGWNGKGMWLVLVEDTHAINFDNPESGELEQYENHPYIVMKTVEGKIVPWVASQSDVLAEDWCLVEG